MTRPIDVVLWVVVPYVCLAVFVLGHVWRYRYDKFGWTTRSSQMYERRLLRWGSPLFHFGILFAFLLHVMGLGSRRAGRRPSASPTSSTTSWRCRSARSRARPRWSGWRS